MSDGRVTAFQEKANERIRAILEAHGIDAPFQEASVGPGYLAATFKRAGKVFTIELGPDFVQMEEGTSLFEAYRSRAGEPLETLIDEFAERLDRYLAGGSWED